jgi:translation initiation factor 5A
VRWSNFSLQDIFTGQELEITVGSSQTCDVPNVRRFEYQLVNIDDGYLNLMPVDGPSKDDLKLPDGELGKKIEEAFKAGTDLLVTVISAMNEEMAVSFKEAPKM